MKTIGIITKPTLTEVKPVLAELVRWLQQQRRDIAPDVNTSALLGLAVPQMSEIAARADMVVVLGGDGTMLSAARLVEERSIPILGVNMGGLGFLTEVGLDHLYEALKKVFAQQFVLESRLMLRARIQRGGEDIYQTAVLNDVVVSKGVHTRMIEIQIRIDSQFVTNLRGDGLIVSTPTGSTAYSLSAGGPIVHPSVDAITLTPICPHTLSHRPLLIPSSGRLEARLIGREEGAITTFDGQDSITVNQGDVIAIRASTHRTQLIRFPDRTYFDVLRRKLRWGDG
jgi:NAD+ kinase